MARLVFACCGITAGSGTATTELRLLLLEIYDDTYSIWTSVSLSLYVDDLTIEAHGTFMDTRVAVAGATDYVVRALGDMGLDVSIKKSVAVANRYSLSRAIARTSATRKLTAKRGTKLLGAPSGGGRVRTVGALAARILKFRQKIPRIHAVRRLGIRVPQMVRAMGTPSITYGVETVGMADSHLDNARGAIAKAAAPEGSGKSVDLVLYAADLVTGTMDPAFDANVLPVYYWSLAWWEGWKPHNTMTRAGETAIAKLQDGVGSPCRRVSGPATAVIATLVSL